MLRRIMPLSCLLAALGLVVLPAAVMAQTAVSHSTVYTARSMSKLLGGTKPAPTNMPPVSFRQLPMAAMQRNNTLPSGAYALRWA
jgi:hypothetical protein